MRELLDYLARELVDEPDAVAVEEFEEDDGTVVLELSARTGQGMGEWLAALEEARARKSAGGETR